MKNRPVMKMHEFDKRFYQETNQKQLIAGIDEAGRGPLAGPVVAACVLLPKGYDILGLDDSKKLTEKKRLFLETIIKEIALDWAVVFCPAKMIDRINILEATKLAMAMSCQYLKLKPDVVLVDAIKIDYFPVKHHAIIKGDTKSAVIAAASILAKQARDGYMKEMDGIYPEYGFKQHKGYPTKMHFQSIKRYGPSPEHRLTFRGVR